MPLDKYPTFLYVWVEDQWLSYTTLAIYNEGTTPALAPGRCCASGEALTAHMKRYNSIATIYRYSVAVIVPAWSNYSGKFVSLMVKPLYKQSSS